RPMEVGSDGAAVACAFEAVRPIVPVTHDHAGQGDRPLLGVAFGAVVVRVSTRLAQIRAAAVVLKPYERVRLAVEQRVRDDVADASCRTGDGVRVEEARARNGRSFGSAEVAPEKLKATADGEQPGAPANGLLD